MGRIVFINHHLGFLEIKEEFNTVKLTLLIITIVFLFNIKSAPQADKLIIRRDTFSVSEKKQNIFFILIGKT